MDNKNQKYKKIIFIPLIFILLFSYIIGYKIVENSHINTLKTGTETGSFQAAESDNKKEIEDKTENIYIYELDDGENPLNLNTATEQDIEDLPEIGKEMAKKIVVKRSEIKGFDSIYDLTYVGGISEETIKSLSKLIYIEGKNEKPKDEQIDKININTASADELCELDGIGEKTTAKIIEKREEIGGFKSINDLEQVKGIGKTKFLHIKGYIKVE